jgi:outer membrane protein assembly factor BamB
VHDRRHARAVRLAGIVMAVTAAAAVLAGAAAAQVTQPAAWPQFQGGPGHEGFREDGPAPPYRVRWSLPDPSGDRLSPAIVVGDVSVTVGPEAVYGVDLSDGSIAWEIPRQGGPISPPAVGTVGGQDVLVYLEGPAPVSAEGGPSPTTGTDATTTPATGATATTPTDATEDDVGDGEEVSELVGVTLADRTERWRVRLDATARSGVTIEGDAVYVGDQGGTLSAFSLTDGTSRWSNSVTGRIDTPVAVADGAVSAVARDSDESRVALVSFDAATGERSWPPFVVPATSTAGSGPSAAGGRVFLASADRVVRAVNGDDGTEVWSSLVLSLFSPTTAPALGDGSVFAADFGGGLYRLEAGDGERVWSHQLNEVILRGTPVVSGDAVLVGLADGRLVAIDVASGHLVWQDDLTEGSLGAVAIGDDVLVAVTGGPKAGLVALEQDPEGALVDVPSPTEFDPATTFARYAAAAAIVFAVAFVPGIYARRRFGSGVEPASEGDDELEGDPDTDEPGG